MISLDKIYLVNCILSAIESTKAFDRLQNQREKKNLLFMEILSSEHIFFLTLITTCFGENVRRVKKKFIESI